MSIADMEKHIYEQTLEVIPTIKTPNDEEVMARMRRFFAVHNAEKVLVVRRQTSCHDDVGVTGQFDEAERMNVPPPLLLDERLHPDDGQAGQG